MSTRLQTRAVALRRRRTEVVGQEDDRGVWGAIFTAVAITGLCVATLFSVGIG
jgi:hypothetical protein